MKSNCCHSPNSRLFPAGTMPLFNSSLLVLALAFLAGCGGHPSAAHGNAPPSLPVVPVRVQAVESQLQTNTEEVVATVRSKRQATLEAKVSGRIDQMPVVLGQPVKTGQLIARLDAAELNARLEQAHAALQQAERDWSRISTLFQGQAVTRSELESAEVHLRQAKAGVAEAEAMMRYVDVTAPFDGVVTRKLAEVGDLASPGKPLAEIEDPTVLQLHADVPETLADRIQPGTSLTVRVSSNGELTGTVTEIAPSIDAVTRTFRIKLELPPTEGIRSGQFARVLVPIGQTQRLQIPAAAVVQRGQMEIAFVVADGTARLHLVKTGKRINGELEILSGLDQGDRVIIQGGSTLRDGQPVEVQ